MLPHNIFSFHQQSQKLFLTNLDTPRFTFSFRCLAWLTFWFITAVIQSCPREFKVSSSVWRLQSRVYSLQLISGFCYILFWLDMPLFFVYTYEYHNYFLVSYFIKTDILNFFWLKLFCFLLKKVLTLNWIVMFICFSWWQFLDAQLLLAAR